MGILTVTGGLTVATVVFFWAFVKLALGESNAIGHCWQAYRAFLMAVMAVVFLPPLGETVLGFISWALAVVG